MSELSSRDNPRVRRWSRLVQDGRFRKKEGRVVLEGPHLVGAALDRSLVPLALLVGRSAMEKREIATLVERAGVAPVVLTDAVFATIADAESPPGIAIEIATPALDEKKDRSCVFLEAVQDAGNVGAIIRTAAALGVGAVIVDANCADPWSPKVLRAGMGGHFAVHIRSIPNVQPEVERFAGRVLCTIPRGGAKLRDADLSGRLGWVFGSEGRGLSTAVQTEADLLICIETAPGTESLNVAATAAICLYEAASRPGGGS